MLGMRMTRLSRCQRDSMKAGSTPKIGNGEYRVGTPDEKSATQAGMSKQSPAAITSAREFIPVLIASTVRCFKSAARMGTTDDNRRHSEPANE